MYCSNELIKEIKQKINIKEYISRKIQLEYIGNQYVGSCPFDNSKSKTFMVDEEKQLYKCFGCGCGGDVFDFMMNFFQISFSEAVRILAAKLDIPIDRNMCQEEYYTRQKQIIKINQFASGYYHNLLTNTPKALEYLGERGILQDTMNKYMLGYADSKNHIFPYLQKAGFTDETIVRSGLVSFPEGCDGNIKFEENYDKFYNRIIFPIINENQVVIGFGGRVMTNRKPKYINSKESIVYDKSCNLYGLNIAKKSERNYFLLSEGFMDVIAMHQAGFTNAVASLGTSLTENQVHKLSKFKKTFILTYDSDEAGIQAVKRAIPILTQFGVKVKVVDLNPYKDPDEFIKSIGANQFQKRIESAINVESWFVKQIMDAETDNYGEKLLNIMKIFDKRVKIKGKD